MSILSHTAGSCVFVSRLIHRIILYSSPQELKNQPNYLQKTKKAKGCYASLTCMVCKPCRVHIIHRKTTFLYDICIFPVSASGPWTNGSYIWYVESRLTDSRNWNPYTKHPTYPVTHLDQKAIVIPSNKQAACGASRTATRSYALGWSSFSTSLLISWACAYLHVVL